MSASWKRSSAINVAKEAFRLFVLRAIKVDELTILKTGYRYESNGWIVLLDDTGRVTDAWKPNN